MTKKINQPILFSETSKFIYEYIRKREKSCPRLILRRRRRRLERRRIVWGLNSLLESFDTNGIRKREILCGWEKEQLPSEIHRSFWISIYF